MADTQSGIERPRTLRDLTDTCRRSRQAALGRAMAARRRSFAVTFSASVAEESPEHIQPDLGPRIP